MVPDEPALPSFHPDRAHHPVGTPGARVARGAAAHPRHAQRARRRAALRADDRDHRGRAVWFDNWFVWIAAFLLMGRAHAQFAALMHEAAHRLLFRNRKVNDFVGRWLLGFPSFTPIDAYRRSHMAHHRDEFGPEEPDIPLYRGYPISKDSFRRKLVRDAHGPDRLQAVQGPAPRCRRRQREHPIPSARDRRHAARVHRDRHRARPPVGVLHPVARAVPDGVARDQPAALDRRTRRHATVEGPPPDHALRCASTSTRASCSCRTTSAGTSRTTSTRACRWRTFRSSTASSSARATSTTRSSTASYPALWRKLASGTTSNAWRP